MRSRRIARGLAAAALGALAACSPGDGSTLDEYGESTAHPFTPSLGSHYGGASFPASFSGIQKGFLEAFCTECHSGSLAPRGLDLSDAGAYGRLVGVPSAERSDLLRVDPGHPERSYLIMKLEGAAGIVGRQMPRDRPARPQEEIDTIRQWIASGAAND